MIYVFIFVGKKRRRVNDEDTHKNGFGNIIYFLKYL
jgi:hypothetical protein